jgi:hypothetical protein
MFINIIITYYGSNVNLKDYQNIRLIRIIRITVDYGLRCAEQWHSRKHSGKTVIRLRHCACLVT